MIFLHYWYKILDFAEKITSIFSKQCARCHNKTSSSTKYIAVKDDLLEGYVAFASLDKPDGPQRVLCEKCARKLGLV